MHRNLECKVYESRQIECGQAGDGKHIKILGISELKWMGLDRFNSEDYYINYKKQQLEPDMEQLLVPNWERSR